MKRIVFRPLKEEYKVIELRCTDLEKYVNPPIFTQDDPQLRSETFWIGNLVESVVQATCLFGKDAGLAKANKISQMIEHSNTKHTEKKKSIYKWIQEDPTKYVEMICDEGLHLRDFDTANERCKIQIECSGFLVILTGEFDLALTSKYICDQKTSSSRRTEEVLEEKRQKYYYPFLDMVSMGHKNPMDFEYWVFQKSKGREVTRGENKGQSTLQILKETFTYEECFDKVKRDMHMFLHNLVENPEELKKYGYS